jgi:hypothetical protein
MIICVSYWGEESQGPLPVIDGHHYWQGAVALLIVS